jgi:hypothetical protein|nr:MAG TPA: hypothetical protein [Caudoviricetes sp.]
MSNNKENKSHVLELLSNVLEISEQKTESGKYKVTGIKTCYKSDNDKVTVIGNIAVIDIDNYAYEYIDTQFLTSDEIGYNPDDFEFPANIDVTKIGYTFIITGLDPRMYSVDNKCVVGCSPVSYYPTTLRHHGFYGFNENHRFMVKLPKDEVKYVDDFNPVFSDLARAVEFRNELYKQNKHKYKDFIKNDIAIHYFDAMSDGIDNKDLIEYDQLLSFIKINKNTFSLPLDIGDYESYHNGIWLHPEGKNNGIVDSPDRYYHKELYEIDGKTYQADFLTIKRDKEFIPRGLLAEFLSQNRHITKVSECAGKCLFVDNLVDDFIKFIRNYNGYRNIAEKVYVIQDMLRDGALSNKMIAYNLNTGISDIVNDNSKFMLLENDNQDNTDGFYLAPNRMSSYIKPVLPSNGSKNKPIGKLYTVDKSIDLPKGEYVLFHDIYFKSTLAMLEGDCTYGYFPLRLLVKFSEIDKYLIATEENKDTFFNDGNLVYCNEICGVEKPAFNYFTKDEILTYGDVSTITEDEVGKGCVFKIAEGIYGCVHKVYLSQNGDELKPFTEYLPN